MPKRLVLSFDGTWNAPEDRTNPYRIHKLVASESGDGIPQLVYYDEGVGTHWHDWFTGGAFGRGLSRNIRQGYRWLAQRYRPGDSIYIFGFSRGAYTARSLVGLLRKAGLVKATDGTSDRALGDLIQQAYELYRIRHDSPDAEEARAFRDANSHVVRVKFIGVWDTVGALGIPFPRIPLGRDYYQFHDTGLSGIVENAYHAVAVDEQREIFSPTLWTRVPEHTVAEQRWFIGAHANVGGGYQRDPLPDLSLRWIQQKARACGLAMHTDVVVNADAHRATINDSFREFMFGAYRILRMGRRHHRPIGITVNEALDESVLMRRRDDVSYRPPGLEAYLARRPH